MTGKYPLMVRSLRVFFFILSFLAVHGNAIAIEVEEKTDQEEWVEIDLRDIEPPLVSAVRKGQIGQIKQAIDTRDVKLNEVTVLDETLLLLAAQHQQWKVFDALIPITEDVNYPNIDGETVFHFIARFGRLEQAESLFEKGGNPFVVSKGGNTPYNLAVEYKNKPLRKYILSKGSIEFKESCKPGKIFKRSIKLKEQRPIGPKEKALDCYLENLISPEVDRILEKTQLLTPLADDEIQLLRKRSEELHKLVDLSFFDDYLDMLRPLENVMSEISDDVKEDLGRRPIRLLDFILSAEFKTLLQEAIEEELEFFKKERRISAETLVQELKEKQILDLTGSLKEILAQNETLEFYKNLHRKIEEVYENETFLGQDFGRNCEDEYWTGEGIRLKEQDTDYAKNVRRVLTSIQNINRWEKDSISGVIPEFALGYVTKVVGSIREISSAITENANCEERQK